MDPKLREYEKRSRRLAREIERDVDRASAQKQFGPLGPYMLWIAGAVGFAVFLWLQIEGVETENIYGWTDRAVLGVAAFGGTLMALIAILGRR